MLPLNMIQPENMAQWCPTDDNDEIMPKHKHKIEE